MKKMALGFGIATLFCATFIFIKYLKKPIPNALYTVAILQTASHPALDAACEGFIEELKGLLNNNVAFVLNNAQGSIAVIYTAAQQLHTNNEFDGFFAIATPAAQAMHATEKKRPIFIAAVTDPESLGLLEQNTNVCGTNDMIDVARTVEMLTQLIPTARRIGLLYTAGETNAELLANRMEQELKKHNFIPLRFAVSNEADMQTVVELACRKTDAILAPTDNTVALTIALIARITRRHKKPLIVSDNMLVGCGALAACGVDYRESGKQTAAIAYQVLVEGKKPYQIPIQQTKSEKIVINKKVLEELALSIPSSLHNNVIVIP